MEWAWLLSSPNIDLGPMGPGPIIDLGPMSKAGGEGGWEGRG